MAYEYLGVAQPEYDVVTQSLLARQLFVAGAVATTLSTQGQSLGDMMLWATEKRVFDSSVNGWQPQATPFFDYGVRLDGEAMIMCLWVAGINTLNQSNGGVKWLSESACEVSGVLPGEDVKVIRLERPQSELGLLYSTAWLQLAELAR